MERVVDMNNVVDLSKKREERAPHNAGIAVCAACKHSWVATAEKGVLFLECPECHTHKGRFVHPSLVEPGADRDECHCGCQLFMANKKVLSCINCGSEYFR